MTPKEQRFADLYLADQNRNASKAYEGAGFKARGAAARVGASKLLTKPNVVHYVKSALAKDSEDLGIDRKYVIGCIQETVDRCRQARPVTDKQGKPIMVETPDGDIAPAFTFDATNVLKGSEMLGRHIDLNGFSKDNKDLAPVTNNTLVIMDDNNRLEIARRLAFVLARGAKLAK